MPAYVKVNGVCKKVSKIYDKTGGVLKEVKKGYDRVSGTLRLYHQQSLYLKFRSERLLCMAEKITEK